MGAPSMGICDRQLLPNPDRLLENERIHLQLKAHGATVLTPHSHFHESRVKLSFQVWGILKYIEDGETEHNVVESLACDLTCLFGVLSVWRERDQDCETFQ